MRENAHPLKSSSFTLGFMAIGGVAKNIELLAKDKKNIDLISKEYHELISRYKETMVLLMNFRRKIVFMLQGVIISRRINEAYRRWSFQQ